jgi:hypothetical protein
LITLPVASKGNVRVENRDSLEHAKVSVRINVRHVNTAFLDGNETVKLTFAPSSSALPRIGSIRNTDKPNTFQTSGN